jgi:hypothetical protein
MEKTNKLQTSQSLTVHINGILIEGMELLSFSETFDSKILRIEARKDFLVVYSSDKPLTDPYYNLLRNIPEDAKNVVAVCEYDVPSGYLVRRYLSENIELTEVSYDKNVERLILSFLVTDCTLETY